ncbi:MAG: transcriptional regulator [Candidatus Hodarchaeota archaeon]
MSLEKEITKISNIEEILPPPNPVFSSSPRLAIMLILYFYKKVTFPALQKLLKVTPGNLDYHLRTLESEQYIQFQKILLPRPFTVIRLTTHGVEVFREYTTKLRDILNKIE